MYKTLNFKSCIDACLSCAVQCEYTASEFQRISEIRHLAEFIFTSQDCADLCFITAASLIYKSDQLKELIEECIETCQECIHQCEKHNEQEHCLCCAKACSKCIEECLIVKESLQKKSSSKKYIY